MLSTGQIRLVHLAKDRLELTDDEYYDILVLYGGVRSSRELTPAGFFNVMEHFRELGFTPRGTAVKEVREAPSKGVKFIEMVTPGQRAKIYELTALLGWADNPARLRGFMAKRFGITRVLTKEQAIKVIEALKAMLSRQKDAGTGS